MKLQQLAIALTVVNLVLLLFTMTQVRSTTAQTVTPILRGRTLELVDETWGGPRATRCEGAEHRS
jgi:hypothetical protein